MSRFERMMRESENAFQMIDAGARIFVYGLIVGGGFVAVSAVHLASFAEVMPRIIGGGMAVAFGGLYLLFSASVTD